MSFRVCTACTPCGRIKTKRFKNKNWREPMKAVLSHTAGGPETLVLEDVADPVAGPGAVVVAVKACGVNYPDVLTIQDLYQTRPPRPFSPGTEIAGIVEQVGSGVTTLKVGDRVLGPIGYGGMAEKVAVPADRLQIIPDGMPFDQAAAFLATYNTSYMALKDRADLKAGERLLVLGAGGGVGLAAVELGKAFGAYVIAAASSEEKVAAARKMGADETLVYPPGPFDRAGQKALSEMFKSVAGPKGFDVVYDPVGGDYAEAALRSMNWGGRFLVVGFTAGIPKIALNLPLLKTCQIVGVYSGGFKKEHPDKARANAESVVALYKAGKVKPYVSRHYPLAKAGEAIASLQSRSAVGKVVVTTE
jgi:NADPH2:quinone reductase